MDGSRLVPWRMTSRTVAGTRDISLSARHARKEAGTQTLCVLALERWLGSEACTVQQAGRGRRGRSEHRASFLF